MKNKMNEKRLEKLLNELENKLDFLDQEIVKAKEEKKGDILELSLMYSELKNTLMFIEEIVESNI